MPATSLKSRRLGHVCRIYKNSASSIIAMDSIDVSVNVIQKPDHTFYRSVNSVDISRQTLHLTVGGSRVVSSIQMIGDYSSIEENSGNFLVATWNKNSSDENDVVTSFENHVAVIGDSV